MATKRTSRKKAAPARGTRSTQQKNKNTRLHGVLARFLVGFFAVFLMITFFPQIDSGFLGGVREILRGLFGFGYYMFPFLLLFIVFSWGRGKENSVAATRTVLAVVAFLFLLFLTHLLSVHGTENVQDGDAVKSFEGL